MFCLITLYRFTLIAMNFTGRDHTQSDLHSSRNTPKTSNNPGRNSYTIVLAQNSTQKMTLTNSLYLEHSTFNGSETFEMRTSINMQNVIWSDRVRNENPLRKIGERRKKVKTYVIKSV